MAAGAPPPFATGETADISGYPADFHMRIRKGDVTEKVRRNSTWI